MILYFGCLPGTTGHFLYHPSGGSIYQLRQYGVPWELAELDGKLCPDDPAQLQGVYRHHERGSWVAIAFWDRSGDSRGNSCSVFLTDEPVSSPALIHRARETWGPLFARMAFDLRRHNAT